jgi:hypothetical protein
VRLGVDAPRAPQEVNGGGVKAIGDFEPVGGGGACASGHGE